MNSTDLPEPLDPRWIRLSTSKLPPYCFIPGRSPHPRRDPQGHSYGRPEPRAGVVAPEAWRANETYRYGIDLYNLGFFWESHEAFEALWQRAVDPVQRKFLQGIIQVAAANLKWRMGAPAPARALAGRGLARLTEVPSPYMGLDVEALRDRARRYFSNNESSADPPVITLAEPVAPG